MSVTIDIDVTGVSETGLAQLTAALQSRGPLHAKIAEDAERFTKDFGSRKAAGEHRTASRLGAQQTGHLERAYAGIQQQSDATEARLLVPRASRLRAAFGDYVLTPRKKYLTIPITSEAYGRRALEFTDLSFIRLGFKGTPFLVRKEKDGTMKPMYLLVTSAKIEADETLIPFKGITDGAVDSVEEFYDDIVRRNIA